MEDIRNQFIVSSDKYTGNIDSLAVRAIKFGKVTEKGDIIIENAISLTKEDIIKLGLVLRFIAHAFDESISDALSPTDLAEVSHQRVEAVGSKLSELATKTGFAKKIGHGQYVVQSYKIDSFLTDLESKSTSEKKNGTKSSKKVRRSGESTKVLTGVGRDIQGLIDNGFFDEPKFTSEVMQELKREGFYHDPKVVDRTITTTFLKNRRTLKRIPNEDGGLSRWKYLIRK